MKKIHIISLVASALICGACIVYTIIPKRDKLPSFDLQLPDSSKTLFNTGDLPDNRVTALIYFSPDCEDCQLETKNILSRMADLNQITFCYVTSDSLPKVKAFNDYFSLDKYPNIVIGRDSAWYFFRYFRPKGTPTIVLYNKKKELYALSTGTMSIDTLLHYVKSM